MTEILTPYQQRVIRFGIAKRHPFKQKEYNNSESNYTIGDCLALGVLFIQTEGHIPVARDIFNMNFLPSIRTICKHFKTVEKYQKCLRYIHEKPLA